MLMGVELEILGSFFFFFYFQDVITYLINSFLHLGITLLNACCMSGPSVSSSHPNVGKTSMVPSLVKQSTFYEDSLETLQRKC